MARIRTVKPEFFRHEELYELEKKSGLPCRVAFMGLFGVCDREGRFRWRPRVLKLDVLPFDDLDFEDVLKALEKGGFIRSWIVNGKQYGDIPTLKDHQSINQREAPSLIPPYKEHMRAYASTCVHSDGEKGPLGDVDGQKRPENGQNGGLDESLCSEPSVSGKTDESICTHMHAHGEGKGREYISFARAHAHERETPIFEDSEIESVDPYPFEEAWSRYPGCLRTGRARKGDKEQARKKWVKLVKSGKGPELMLALDGAVLSSEEHPDAWLPYMTKWLNGGWEDFVSLANDSPVIESDVGYSQEQIDNLVRMKQAGGGNGTN